MNQLNTVRQQNNLKELNRQRKSERADREADKLFNSNDPITRQYMENLSDIISTDEAVKSAERYLNADYGVPFEMNRDKTVIYNLKAMHSKYLINIIGLRPIRMRDIRIAKSAIASRHHAMALHLQSLAQLVLTPKERKALASDKDSSAKRSALNKLGLNA